ncbi:MAG: hypothetical protein ACTSPB_18680 [Candidatus Thorarchaeota archaeon]
MKHRTRITLIVVVLLATLAMSTSADMIVLPLIVHQASNTTVSSHTFEATIHGRPVELYVTVNDDIWTLEIAELDDAPPTITPTPSITIQPSITPTLEPYTDGYASLKTSDIYHKVTCSYLNGKDPSQLDYYATCEIAIASGKRACSRCKPCQ